MSISNVEAVAPSPKVGMSASRPRPRPPRRPDGADRPAGRFVSGSEVVGIPLLLGRLSTEIDGERMVWHGSLHRARRHRASHGPNVYSRDAAAGLRRESLRWPRHPTGTR